VRSKNKFTKTRFGGLQWGKRSKKQQCRVGGVSVEKEKNLTIKTGRKDQSPFHRIPSQ